MLIILAFSIAVGVVSFLLGFNIYLVVALAASTFVLSWLFSKVSFQVAIMVFVLAVVSSSLALLVSAGLGWLEPSLKKTFVPLLLTFLSAGASHMLSHWNEIHFFVAPTGNVKILDSSVIIDGRIADVVETGFIEGLLVIPRFVLNEVQHIADSKDPLKKVRGRRGLEILEKLQLKHPHLVKVVDKDYPQIKETDLKLVMLAKEMKGKILTNDYNLNKVAQLHGIKVLNVNELAHALKPMFMPGELITVKIVKPGTEPSQGIAYLEDGTMVVVEGGRDHVDKVVEVIITNVLQTPTGRMFFAKFVRRRR